MTKTKIDIKEAKVGMEFRSELVCKEDIPKIVKMTKDELQAYAHSRLGNKLDLSRRIKLLRLDVATSVKEKLKLPKDSIEEVEGGNEVKEKVKDEKAEFVFEPKRRRVFEATDMLLKRTDLIHCWIVDKDGKKL
jgi:hypothetical protein